jgi:serine/threonine protein phosphatase PrpC
MLYGVHQLDGRGRPSEDRAVIYKLTPEHSLFAVFDGHGGSGAVKLTMDALPRRIANAITTQHLTDPVAIANALRHIFVEHDKELARNLLRVRESGSTASVAIVTPTHIIMAYVGDSPAFLMDPLTGLILKEIGKHEPTLATETERIRRAGGSVEIDEYGTPRVDGLMVSRAFGDFSLKFDIDLPPPFETTDWSQMKVTAAPDIVVWARPDVGVLAILSDGLVETATNALKPTAQVAKDVFDRMREHSYNLQVSAQKVCEAHVAEATRGMRAGAAAYDGDDLSLILVDIGKRAAGTAAAAGQAGGSGLLHQVTATLTRPTTRKAHGRRRNRTGKKHRVIKILGF